MDKVFLVPGLGADYRAFNNIHVEGYERVNVSWIDPDKKDTLSSYAAKLIEEYKITPDSVVIGNSLGGMLAIEIAKQVRISRVILISSVKTIDELPLRFKWFRLFPIYKILPAKLFNSLGIFVRFAFGKMPKEDQWLFIDMLKKTSPKFAKWAVGAILDWKNQAIPPNVYHISGDKDLMFPINMIKDVAIIKGGTHGMILNRAKEINNWLKNILSH